MSEKSLKNCPFCGEELETLTMCIKTQKRKISPDDIYICCYHCGACGPSGWNKEEAIAKWNGREEGTKINEQ